MLFVAFCVALIPVRVCLGRGAALPGAVESRVRRNSDRSVRLVCQYGQSGIVWLSLGIWLTCLIILGFVFFFFFQMQRERGSAPKSSTGGEQSAVRRWVGQWSRREDVAGGYMTPLRFVCGFYFEGAKVDMDPVGHRR